MKDYPWPVNPRKFVVRNVWVKLPDGSFVYTWDNHDGIDTVKNLYRRALIKGMSKGFATIKSIPGLAENDKRCEITWVCKADLRGRVPQHIMNASIHKALSVLRTVQDIYNRDDEIDVVERKKLVALIKQNQQHYTEEEVSE